MLTWSAGFAGIILSRGGVGPACFCPPLAKIVCDGICADACGSCSGLFYFRRIITNFMIVLFLFLMLIISFVLYIGFFFNVVDIAVLFKRKCV